MELNLSKEVMTNDALRTAYNGLTVRTYGFSFENWYQQGYWSEFHIPYTLFDGKNAVSNVSVNQMDIFYQGKIYKGIQLGTVMTDKNCRNQGLCRRIMETVLDDWKDKCDVMFLFANDSVLDFYPKFGFEKKMQYQFQTRIDKVLDMGEQLQMGDQGDRELLKRYYEKGNPFSKMQVVDNYGLLMFYCGFFMEDCIYYVPEYDAVVVAEQEDEILRCYDIFCDEGKSLSDILSAMAEPGTTKAVLEFTPKDEKGFEISPITDEDDVLFVLSKGEKTVFDGETMIFPSISHT